MKFFSLAVGIAVCSAFPHSFSNNDRMAAIYGGGYGNNMTAAVKESTDCHKWDWFYCPRDPGDALFSTAMLL